MLFKQVAGNNNIKEILIQQVQKNRVSHAQLFFGSEGSGCLAMALAFARYICCHQKQENDSCGACSSCIKFDKLVHPDFHMVFPVNSRNSANKITTCDELLTDWRSMLLNHPYFNLFDWLKSLGIENKQGNISAEEGTNIIRKLNLTTYEGGYKIMLIWMPECMHPTTANRLLKILEEPPEKTVFILVTESPEQLLSTIKSRVQAIRFRPLSQSEMSFFLQNELELSQEKSEGVAALSDGNLNLAIKLAQEDSFIKKDIADFLDWMRICYSLNIPKLLEWVNNMSELGRENQKNFISRTLQFLRQALLLNLKLPGLVNLSEEEKAQLIKFSPFVHAFNSDDMYEALDKAYYALERNAHAKMLFLNLSFKIGRLLNRRVNKQVA